MKIYIRNVFVFPIIYLLCVYCAQAEIAVIVHPNHALSELSEKEVKSIFLGKNRAFSNGEIAVPIMLKGDIKDKFTKSYLKKRPNQLTAYWSKLVFTGGGQPPKEVDSSSEMIELIGNNQNMIGFIDSGSINDTVKVVHKK